MNEWMSVMDCCNRVLYQGPRCNSKRNEVDFCAQHFRIIINIETNPIKQNIQNIQLAIRNDYNRTCAMMWRAPV